MNADRVAQRALDLHDKASMPLAEALALAISEAAPGPIWPCAKLVIRNGVVCVSSHQYAPGLPDGEHDVYPLPVDSDAEPAHVVAPSQDLSKPVMLDIGFKYENGFHTPTVLVGFAPKDWDARDAFVKELTERARGVPTGEPRLSDEDIAAIAERMEAIDPSAAFWREFARAVEAHVAGVTASDSRSFGDQTPMPSDKTPGG